MSIGKFLMEDSKMRARYKGLMAWRRGNFRLACDWWSRYDELVLLAFRRKNQSPDIGQP